MIRWADMELPEFRHMYNLTMLNERAVEVAIAHHWLADRGTLGLLEVGNVLGHYERRHHDVVDMTEAAAWYQEPNQGVHQYDLFDWPLSPTWRSIVCISTIEHVVETRPDLGHAGGALALMRLRSLLNDPEGRALVTWPGGVNPILDEMVATETTGAHRWATYARDTNGDWAAMPHMVLPYGSRDLWAASVFVGEFGPLPAQL